jgi:hypothetical protein
MLVDAWEERHIVWDSLGFWRKNTEIAHSGHTSFGFFFFLDWVNFCLFFLLLASFCSRSFQRLNAITRPSYAMAPKSLNNISYKTTP